MNPVLHQKPVAIGIPLSPGTRATEFSVENVTIFDLTIKELKLNGKFYGLVDREKVENWLYNYVGETRYDYLSDEGYHVQFSEAPNKTYCTQTQYE